MMISASLTSYARNLIFHGQQSGLVCNVLALRKRNSMILRKLKRLSQNMGRRPGRTFPAILLPLPVSVTNPLKSECEGARYLPAMLSARIAISILKTPMGLSFGYVSAERIERGHGKSFGIQYRKKERRNGQRTLHFGRKCMYNREIYGK